MLARTALATPARSLASGARRSRSVLSAGGLAPRVGTTPEPAAQASSTMAEVALAERRTEETSAATLVRPEGDVVAAGVVSGAPEELSIRPVRIYQPAPVRRRLRSNVELR